MRLDLAKLHAFVEVARSGSYGAAARRLHVTQSAISHALRKLQDSTERPLIEWRGRSCALTGEGEYLYQICQRVFGELEEADRRLSSGGEVAQNLVLGSTVEFGSTVLLQKLRPLVAAHPALHVDFHFSHDLAEMLRRDEIDLAVDCKPHLHPGILRIPMFREKYVTVASPSFLERHPVRSPLDLRRTPVLSLDREGSWWNNLLRALPTSRRPALERIVVVDHVRGMINGTLAGYGVGLVPKYAVLGELSRRALAVLFPRLRLADDTFCIYQKPTRAERTANRLVTEFLLALDVHEFGDAIRRAA
jgi:DNA-binding transcriptional LysR family regulator